MLKKMTNATPPAVPSKQTKSASLQEYRNKVASKKK
jgi:hypothetical protein